MRRLFPFALFVVLMAAAVRPTIDPDMWWHLRTGEAILSGGIPRTDLFSFTFPANEWVAHEWLSQILMWSLFQLGGLVGLSIFFAAVTAATWGLVYLISDDKPYVAGIVVAVAATTSSIVWGSRPQLFSLLFLAAFLFLIEKRRSGALGRWVFVAFPVLTVLWANLHSGYLLGIVVLGTYLVGDYLESRRSTPDVRALSPSDLRLLAVATAASAVAALANPNGARIWWYPFETLFSTVQRELIIEWLPPRPTQLVFWLVGGLVIVGIVAFVRALRGPSITDLLVFGGTAVGAYLSLRNIPIFTVASAPILCRYLATALPSASWRVADDSSESQRIPTALAAAAIGVAAAAIAATTLVANPEAIRSRFPEAALDWIEADQRTEDRIFNTYDWGGYLIWRGYPVYVDGRADVYGDVGLLRWAQTSRVEPGWEEPLDSYGVDLVLVKSDSLLANKLTDAPGWGLAYADSVARVFARDEPAAAAQSISARQGQTTSQDCGVSHVGSAHRADWTPASDDSCSQNHRTSE